MVFNRDLKEASEGGWRGSFSSRLVGLHDLLQWNIGLKQQLCRLFLW